MILPSLFHLREGKFLAWHINPMNLKDLIKPPPAEGYIKNSSNLVTALFVLAGILYYPTNGYGAVIALIATLIVLIGQKMLIAQTNKDFTEMQLAE